MSMLLTVNFSDDQTINSGTKEEGINSFNSEWEHRDIKKVITDELKEIQLTMVRQIFRQNKLIK